MFNICKALKTGTVHTCLQQRLKEGKQKISCQSIPKTVLRRRKKYYSNCKALCVTRKR